MCKTDKKQSSVRVTEATDTDTTKALTIVSTTPQGVKKKVFGADDKASYVTLSDGTKVYSETGSALNTSEEVAQATARAEEIIAERQSLIDDSAAAQKKLDDEAAAEAAAQAAAAEAAAAQAAIDAASKAKDEEITALENELQKEIDAAEAAGEASTTLFTEKIQSLETQILDLEKAHAETVGEFTAAAAAGIGNTSQTVTQIIETAPDAAMVEQERLAAAELRKQRIERARSKQSLLKRREERIQEVGSGRKVLSGEEMDLGINYRDSLISASTGKRMGSGRRSLLTGSTGGIGYYSRFV
jgi:hypothetical protein